MLDLRPVDGKVLVAGPKTRTASGVPVTKPGKLLLVQPAESPGWRVGTPGLFINTLPVIREPKPDERVGDWLRDLQMENLELREHEHTPLHQIQRWAGPGARRCSTASSSS